MQSLLEPTAFAPVLAEWDIVEWLCGLIYGVMVTILTTGLEFVVNAAEPEFSATSFSSQFDLMRTVGMYLIIPLMMIQTILAVLKGSLKQLLTAYAIAVPAAVLGAPISIVLVRMLQAIDANFVDFIVSFSQTDAEGFLNRINNAEEVIGQSPGIGTLVVLAIGAIIVLVGMLLLLLELAFRAVMLSVSVLFLPLALAAAVWAPSRQFLVTLTETIIVLVFSKFIAVATLFFGLAMGFGALEAQGWDAVEGVIIAGTVIAMACCALPVMLAFVFGQGAATGKDSGAMKVVGVSPMGIKGGNQAVRGMAIAGIKDRGKASVAPKTPNGS